MKVEFEINEETGTIEVTSIDGEKPRVDKEVHPNDCLKAIHSIAVMEGSPLCLVVGGVRYCFP